jgi:hypothetical protein
MQFDHKEAARIVSMTDQQREKAYPSRAAVLLDGSKPKAPTPKKAPTAPVHKKGNIVVAQMKNREFTQAFTPVFAKVRDAVSAAERACQNPSEGVQSKKQADALLEKALTDLATVVESIRDERKVIISDRSAEEAAHPHLTA